MTGSMLARIILALIFCSGLQCSLYGDGLFQKMPHDGAWASFRMTNRLSGPSARESVREGELRISCVGRVLENGQNCRWIEIRDENRHINGRVAYVTITKFLIAEDALQLGKAGHRDILRVWRRKDMDDVELIPGPIEQPMRFGLFFPGATTDADEPVKLEPQTFRVNGKATRIDSVSHQQTEFDTPNYHHVLKFRLWKHAAAPFGVAGARIESQASQNSRPHHSFLRNFELIEWGDDATSELPDRN